MSELKNVRRRKRARSRRWLKPVLLAAPGILAAGAFVLLWHEERPAPSAGDTHTDGVIALAEGEKLERVSVSFGGSAWSAVYASGRLILPDGGEVAPSAAAGLIRAAENVGWTEVLLEDASWQERAAEYGLAEPYLTAEYAYTGGRTVTLRIGDRLAGESASRYLWIEGDSRLLALDVGTADDLRVDSEHLREAKQPGIDKARIDRVRVTDASGVREWTLEGRITDADAADRWYATEPFRYPADSDSADSLRANLANFRVGAFVCEATPEALSQYGFDSPRAAVEVHMAAGRVMTVDSEGQPAEEDRPEETVTILIGDAKTEMTDYVCCRGQIGISSRFLHQGFTSLKVQSTLTRYLVLTSLSSLSRLTVEQDGEKTVWEVSYEGTGADEDAGRYEEESLRGTVTRSGEPYPWEQFEQAWEGLLLVTASGALPEGWAAEEPPHTIWTFETLTGMTRTVALSRFDALHDAVSLDGTARFYLIAGGLRLGEE